MVYRVSPDALFRELRGGAVALNLQTGQYYSLNEMGTRMWLMLQEYGSPDAVVAAIVEEYDVAQEQAAEDLERLLKELQESGLIQKC